MVGARHVVDRGHVARLDHGVLAHVAEQAELAPLLGRNRAIGPAEQDVGLDADRTQLLHRMLRRLGLELARARDEGQQGQVDVDGVAARQLVAELADRLEEGQAFDVADGAADLDQCEIDALVAAQHEVLDGAGHVRDHLDRAAEEVAAPLLGDDLLVDAPRRRRIVARGRAPREPLVMTEVEIGLRAVVGHEDLAVLVGAHRPGVDVQIGVELAQPDGIATRLQQGADGRRGQTLTERGHDAAGDEDIPSHGRERLSKDRRFDETHPGDIGHAISPKPDPAVQFARRRARFTATSAARARPVRRGPQARRRSAGFPSA